MSEFDLEALKREYVASDERGDAKFTIDFYDMTIVLERLEQAERVCAKLKNRLDAMRRHRDGYRNQLRKAQTNQGENNE